MGEVTINELLEAGAHFGHQVSRWNPKMRPYIFASKGGIHILDLEQTARQLKVAARFVSDIVAQGHTCLFVGTKPQAKEVIEAEAKRCQMLYVNTRWLGGMLTNFKTLKASIDRLGQLKVRRESPDYEKLLKKEKLLLDREIVKLERALSGISQMQTLPSVVFIVDPKEEDIVKREAMRLRIPIVAIVDSNCDPTGIDCLIACNDDALRAIQIVTRTIADACLEGSVRHQETLAKAAQKEAAEEKKEGAPLAKERTLGIKGRAYVARARAEDEK